MRSIQLDEGTWHLIQAHEDTELGKPGSGQDITAFERRHGVSLPPSHSEFLLRANGGYVGYARVFGIGRGGYLDIEWQLGEMHRMLQATADGPVLPFANDWGGGYFCYALDRRNEAGEYPVLYWDHEYAETAGYEAMLWSDTAPDFVTFLKDTLL